MPSHEWLADIKGCADALAEYLEATLTSDRERLSKVWHPTGRMYSCADVERADEKKTVGATLVDRGADELLLTLATAEATGAIPEELRALTRVVDVGRCEGAPGTPQDGVLCWAQVEIAAADDTRRGAMLRTEFLVLLKCPEGWRIISKVHSSRPVATAAVAAGIGWETDRANAAGARACVEAYYAAGHGSDADAMVRCYHPCTKLTAPSTSATGATSPSGHDGVFLIPHADFMQRVAARPNTEADPLCVKYDKIMKVMMAGPDAAMVVCHIAYPPILFTDILSLLKFSDNKEKEPEWRIVCKSSVSAKCPTV